MSATANITAALVAVMQTAKSVPETGRNAFANYSYASDRDLLNALQPVLAANGLTLLPLSMTSQTVAHGNSQAQNVKWRTDLLVHWQLLHTSGESLSFETIGAGLDTEDKGAYKAMTGALKYALRLLSLAPCSTGDDAERHTPEQKPTETKKPPGQKKAASPPAAAPKDSNAFNREGAHQKILALEGRLGPDAKLGTLVPKSVQSDKIEQWTDAEVIAYGKALAAEVEKLGSREPGEEG